MARHGSTEDLEAYKVKIRIAKARAIDNAKSSGRYNDNYYAFINNLPDNLNYGKITGNGWYKMWGTDEQSTVDEMLSDYLLRLSPSAMKGFYSNSFKSEVSNYTEQAKSAPPNFNASAGLQTTSISPANLERDIKTQEVEKPEFFYSKYAPNVKIYFSQGFEPDDEVRNNRESFTDKNNIGKWYVSIKDNKPYRIDQATFDRWTTGDKALDKERANISKTIDLADEKRGEAPKKDLQTFDEWVQKTYYGDLDDEKKKKRKSEILAGDILATIGGLGSDVVETVGEYMGKPVTDEPGSQTVAERMKARRERMRDEYSRYRESIENFNDWADQRNYDWRQQQIAAAINREHEAKLARLQLTGADYEK